MFVKMIDWKTQSHFEYIRCGYANNADCGGAFNDVPEGRMSRQVAEARKQGHFERYAL